MSEDARYDSIALLERIATQDPSSPLYLPLAERMREQGRVEEAIRLCEERRGRPGEGVGDRIVLGRCYLAGGRLPEARAQFESAVRLDRENVVALKALAGILSHEGNHASASDFYRAVCRIDPGDLESQTALHQITSGEFPEVRPPDLVVAQGELTWQPVQPPREEEYLGEISLGLHTIESFDSESPRPYEVKVQDFQEMELERFGVDRSTAPEARGDVAVAPPEPVDAAVAPDEPARAEVPPAEPARAAAPQVEAERASDPAPVSDWTELPRSPMPVAEPFKPPRTQQNKSAFETWVRRLKGGAG